MLTEVLMSLTMTLANYIFINAISSSNQKQTVADLKGVLDYIRTDTMNEIKETKEQLLQVIESQNTSDKK